MVEGGEGSGGEGGRSRWTFLTNHAHVLLSIARAPEQSLREVALAVGITERATQTIVADLEAGGYLERRRVGRRNVYALHTELPLRHPLERAHAVGELLEVLLPTDDLPTGGRRAPARRAPD